MAELNGKDPILSTYNFALRTRVPSTGGVKMRYRPEYDMKIVGENLKRLRLANHLSIKEVRDYLRVGSVQAIYKYESGLGYPQVDTMFALMELYGASLEDIVREHERDKNPPSDDCGDGPAA